MLEEFSIEASTEAPDLTAATLHRLDEEGQPSTEY